MGHFMNENVEGAPLFLINPTFLMSNGPFPECSGKIKVCMTKGMLPALSDFVSCHFFPAKIHNFFALLLLLPPKKNKNTIAIYREDSFPCSVQSSLYICCAESNTKKTKKTNSLSWPNKSPPLASSKEVTSRLKTKHD